MNVTQSHKLGPSRADRLRGVTLLLPLLLVTTASAASGQIVVAAGSGAGAPGGSASITMSLTGGGGRVATVGLDVVFDANVLDVVPANCTLAARLASTHTLSPFLPQAGRLRLGIFDLTPPLDTFDDGDLATCTFLIHAGAALGQVQLTVERQEASDNSVPPMVLPSTGQNGTLTIGVVPSTPTRTPVATNTVPPTVVLPTNTPVVPTPTATGTARATNTPVKTQAPSGGGGGGGCVIAADGGRASTGLWWSVIPAVALLLRRRRPRA